MIKIITVPHKLQRYNTIGDWLFIKNNLSIIVSRLGNEEMEFLIGVHELVEAYLCRSVGISQQQVDKFDMGFKGKGEPGNNKKAPYRRQHAVATRIEKILAFQLGIDWKDYSNRIETLSNTYPTRKK